MTSATSTDDDALHETAAAPGGFASLPPHVISTNILRSDFLPEPRDLGRLRAVSKGMRAAVDATGRKVEEFKEYPAVERGYVTTLKCLLRRGRLSDERLLCAAAARIGDLEALKALRAAKWPWEKFPWDGRTCRV